MNGSVQVGCMCAHACEQIVDEWLGRVRCYCPFENCSPTYPPTSLISHSVKYRFGCGCVCAVIQDSGKMYRHSSRKKRRHTTANLLLHYHTASPSATRLCMNEPMCVGTVWWVADYTINNCEVHFEVNGSWSRIQSKRVCHVHLSEVFWMNFYGGHYSSWQKLFSIALILLILISVLFIKRCDMHECLSDSNTMTENRIWAPTFSKQTAL